MNQTPYDLFSLMHYPGNIGCRDNVSCVTVKQQYLRMFTSNGEKLLEKYPVRFFISLKLLLLFLSEKKIFFEKIFILVTFSNL